MVQKGFNGQGGGKHKVLWGSYDLVAVSGLKANGFSAYGRMNNKAGVTMIGSLLESMESFSKGNECPRLPPSGGNRGYHNSISTREIRVQRFGAIEHSLRPLVLVHHNNSLLV